MSPTASALFGAVASFPESSRERAEEPNFIERYLDWRERVLAWVQRRWGQFRLSVVEHRDEAFWHLHVLIVPPMDEAGRLLLGQIHPGHAARGALEREGRSSSVASAAYREAMKALLAEYHREVSAPSGHARTSATPRRRLTREQALTDRRQRDREVALNEQERDLIVASDSLRRREASLDVVSDQVVPARA